MWVGYLSGFQLAIGLIAAIGAQNAFVLRQGLRRQHVAVVVLFCAASDALLIAGGVAGFGAAARAWPTLQQAMLWAGVAFLVAYGARAFLAAWRGGEALRAAEGASPPLSRVLAALAAFTWLNPHVWLDTVVLIGSVSAQYPGHETAFGFGAATASLVFFSALGFGARLLAPLFANPLAWRILDALVGVIMWAIALRLIVA